MRVQNQPTEDDRGATNGFMFLIGSVVVTVVVTIGVMVASLVIAANHVAR
jgi:hypothetical protein